MVETKTKTKTGGTKGPGFAPPAGEGVDDLLDFSFKEIEEGTKRIIVPEDVYTLIAQDSTVLKAVKNDRPNIMVVFKVDGQDKAETVFFNALLPWKPPASVCQEKGIEPGAVDWGGVAQTKEMFKAMDIDWEGPISKQKLVAQIKGKRVKAQLKVGKDQNDEPRNEVKKFIVESK